MANYTLQVSKLYDKQKAGSAGCDCAATSCIGMEVGPYQRHGTLHMSSDLLKANVLSRYNTLPVLVAGDTIEVFEIPTYSRLEDLSVFHDNVMGDFRFELEVANVLDGENCARTVTARTGIQAIADTEAGTTVTYGTAPAALPVIGAAVGRETFHFNDTVRNSHRAVVRLKITAVPAVPAAGQPPAPNFFDIGGLNLFAHFERYASCVCSSTAQGAYDKDKVTTYA